MVNNPHPIIESIVWTDQGVQYLDQTRLPWQEHYVITKDVETIAEAIERLEIRGAPALGVAAAYALVLSAAEARAENILRLRFEKAAERIRRTRPTAVNLFWAIQRMSMVLEKNKGSPVQEIIEALLKEALSIHEEDREMCRRIGRHGMSLIPDLAGILSHCNTGALATGGEGTAQAVITTAFSHGKTIRVYADETRPLLQGARLTAWELRKYGIPVTVIADNTAAVIMKERKVDLVIVGADRIAANGDTVNKIGTYALALLAQFHGIPFYVAAPVTTIDLATGSGDLIPIEERAATDLSIVAGTKIIPDDVSVYAPAFDVTPHRLISAIITDCGVLYPPFEEGLKNIRIHPAPLPDD
jgi:methylthioribose-1-phosphate isomerase